jgi:hypothetical protein
MDCRTNPFRLHVHDIDFGSGAGMKTNACQKALEPVSAR